MSVREPAVAGMFYRAKGLREEIEACFLGPGGPGRLPTATSRGPRRIVGLVSPHAGLIYSGGVAAHSYAALAEDGLPEVAVIIGPNHRSHLPPAALADNSAWRTPLGDIALDADVTRKIAAWPGAAMNASAHAFEHSLEVQVPFLQYIYDAAGRPGMRIVPILIGAAARIASTGGEVEFAKAFGEVIADALQGKDAVVIASTDFTHYESAAAADAKDSRAISRILALDGEGLLRTVDEYQISMCGALPTAVMIAACKKMGASAAEKLAYANSGDVTGDRTEVVGYAALRITRPTG